jgi:hypothetical protein
MKQKNILIFLIFCLLSVTAFAQTTTWDGSDSADWHTAANWSNGVPTSATDVIILNAGTAPIISSATLAVTQDLTISISATLAINGGSALTVSGNLIIIDDDSLTLNSGSSLIVNGTSTGDLKYIREITTTNKWYLVTSPVVGEDSEAFLNNSNLASASNGPDPSNNTTGFGFIPQNGSSQFATGLYNYNQTAGWTYNVSNFGSGYGFTVMTAWNGFLIFTGTMPTTAVADYVLDTPDDYELFGNPYPSYIPANVAADATNNILTINSTTGQDEIKTQTIWFWDQSEDKYITINQASPARFIAPSQGFFVEAGGSGGDSKFDFYENMQSHQTTDTFQKSTNKRPDERPEIKVFIASESNTDNTELYYINGATTGFDNGYDSSIFGGGDNSFVVYSGLVSNSQGEKLAIQSLPNTDYENMVVPVGINAVSGKEIKFSVEALNFPAGINVYLEDRLTNTVTRLDETNSNYSITLTENTNGFGRFYVHTKSSSPLSTDAISLNSISIYKTNATNLRLVGLPQGKSNVKLFSVLGKQVISSDFTSNGVHNVSLPNLATGVYIVQLETENGKLNKKITLE